MAYKPSTVEDLGRLLLRLTLGVLILLHGLSKTFSGIDSILDMVAKTGLPSQLGYLAYVGEVAAPLLLILGIWTRAAALVVAINMLVAVWLVHTKDLLVITQGGGWALELQAMYFFGALAIALLGAGRYSITGAAGRFN